MNKRVAFGGVLAALLLLVCGPVQADNFFGLFDGEKGSGNLTSETREVKAFDRIDLECSMDLEIEIGEPQQVTVVIDDNLQDNIILETVGSRTLLIDAEDIRKTHRKTHIEIRVPTLARLTISGSGDVDINSLEEEDFEIRIEGSGDVNARGAAEHLRVTIAGSGDVDCRSLEASDVDVQINGSGDVSVFAAEEFAGYINGSGDIDVYGDPKRFNRRVNGSGDISRR